MTKEKNQDLSIVSLSSGVVLNIDPNPNGYDFSSYDMFIAYTDGEPFGLECDNCLEHDAVLILMTLDDRATEMRLCKRHALELKNILNTIYP
jgi:hypothetical protein